MLNPEVYIELKRVLLSQGDFVLAGDRQRYYWLVDSGLSHITADLSPGLSASEYVEQLIARLRQAPGETNLILYLKYLPELADFDHSGRIRIAVLAHRIDRAMRHADRAAHLGEQAYLAPKEAPQVVATELDLTPEPAPELPPLRFFGRIDGYVGRVSIVQLLQRYTWQFTRVWRARVLYFQGRGGLGKSYVLENYTRLALIAGTNVRVCSIVDMMVAETRNPLYLEQLLIDGLSRSEAPVEADLVERCFKPYMRARSEYERFWQHTPDEADREVADLSRRETFVACWNELSLHHPLVLRFDTLELLLGQGDMDENVMIRRPAARVGVRRLIEWLVAALSGMQHTLAIFCGRPSCAYEAFDHADRSPNLVEDNELAQRLFYAGLLDVDGFQQLHPFTDHNDIWAYLTASDALRGDEDLSYIHRITGGYPLMLTLYAECQRTEPAPLFRVDPLRIPSREAFEGHLLDTILSPLRFMSPEVGEDDGSRLTLTICLYILSYARRGITPEHLTSVLERVLPGHPLKAPLLDELGKMALVKLIQISGDERQNTLLYLHDEIWLMIDESGAPDELGLREPVLSTLAELSAARVRELVQGDDRQALLRTMADHVYYAVTRNFADGYRFYLVSMDRLLGQRTADDALILADVFWRMLSLTGLRNNEPTRIYQDALSESRRLSYALVFAYDQVHYIKLLRAIGLNASAVEEAVWLTGALVRQELIRDPALVRAEDPTTWPAQLHLFASLILAHAYALTLAGTPEGYAETARRMGRLLDGMLSDPERVETFLAESRQRAERNGGLLQRDDDLLILRRAHLLGTTQILLSQLYSQLLEFDEAVDRARAAISALQDYRSLPLALADASVPLPAMLTLNDEVSDDIAIVQNNLAFAQAEAGNLRGALRLSNELFHNLPPGLQPYNKALIINARAEILIRGGDYPAAEALVDEAEAKAKASNVGRALGMVALTQARVRRWQMNQAQEPRRELDDLFQHVIGLLRGEGELLRDVYYERVRTLRDIAFWYRDQPELEREYLGRALKQIEAALALLPKSANQQAVQRANLLETRVALLSNLGRYDEAWQSLDVIEREVMVHPMPLYGQVVAGKVALQRGLIHLLDEGRRDEEAALRSFTVAMAHVYVFGLRHKDQQTFEKLITRWVGNHIPPANQAVFQRALLSGAVFVGLADLPYQKGHPLTHRRWNEAWELAVEFMDKLLAT